MIIKVAVKCQTGIEEVFCYVLDVKNNIESFCLLKIYNVI